MTLTNTPKSNFEPDQLKSLHREWSRRNYGKSISFETYVDYIWEGYLEGTSVFNFPDWRERVKL